MMRATVDELVRVADWDHPFTVHADGRLTDAHRSVHAPEVIHADTPAPDDVDIMPTSWRPFSTGYTGQHGYRGAIMHASEQLSGRLASDILDTPGTYVVTAVECLPTEDDPEPEPAGWIVLELLHVDYPHEPGRLYDCPACESRCHCTGEPGDTECVYDGPHISGGAR